MIIPIGLKHHNNRRQGTIPFRKVMPKSVTLLQEISRLVKLASSASKLNQINCTDEPYVHYDKNDYFYQHKGTLASGKYVVVKSHFCNMILSNILKI